MDKLLPGLINIIRSYVDYYDPNYDHVDGNDIKKFVHLLLSNSGRDMVAEHVVQNYAKGNDRRTLKLKEREQIIRTSSLNETNGLGNSSIAKDNFITAYIPFLPFERTHVEKCIVDGLFAKGFYEYEYEIDYETVKLIADEMV